ncbi:putative carboxylesterase [Helianthus annuus]|nr:putative carboxylesterase [Helianthus annuus]
MEVGKESVKLSLTNEHIKEAWILSMKAHNHEEAYVISKKASMELLIVSFKGSMEVNGFYQGDDHFGETNVDHKLFPSLQRLAEGQLAKVNGLALQKFKELLNNGKFTSEVEAAVKKGKNILFTGHSFGGALASLATLWMLDQYTRILKSKIQIGCVTFGSPLVGDETLTHAVRREKWAGHFTHFVMEHDIVPRMMLAPKTSVEKHLPTIFKFFKQKVNTLTTKKPNKLTGIFSKPRTEPAIDHDQLVDDKDRKDVEGLFENVLINASTVASHDAFDLMEPTNSLMEKLSNDFVKISPYRPFGVYVFCTRGEGLSTTPRQQLVVENPNAALQLLFYLLQLPNEDQSVAQFAHESLTESFGYEEELNNNGLQLENRVNLKDLNDHLLTSNSTRGDSKALFELNASAKWCLLAVEEAEKRKEKNMDQIKKSMKNYNSNAKESSTKIIEDLLGEVMEYKNKLSDGSVDYYEAFKLQNEHEDFKANVNRLEQAKIWDVIVEMVRRKDLPDEFEVWDELVELGTRFRRVYEPLDIANYYRHFKGDDTGAKYMEVRPKRYKFTQRWHQHANVTGFELVSESNFVAEVEELMNEVIKPKNKTIGQVENDLESLKNKIKGWKCDEKIAKEYVFWGESVLTKLEKKLAEAKQT